MNHYKLIFEPNNDDTSPVLEWTIYAEGGKPQEGQANTFLSLVRHNISLLQADLKELEGKGGAKGEVMTIPNMSGYCHPRVSLKKSEA